MTATKPETATAAVKCNRYPCDTAYRRGTHEPDSDGEIGHVVMVGHESRRSDDGDDLVARWIVRVVSWDDSTWFPEIYVERGRRTFPATDPDEAIRFAAAVNQAVAWAMKANLDDARSD